MLSTGSWCAVTPQRGWHAQGLVDSAFHSSDSFGYTHLNLDCFPRSATISVGFAAEVMLAEELELRDKDQSTARPFVIHGKFVIRHVIIRHSSNLKPR